MKSKNKISIVGGSIWGNRGAEAMLVTTIAEIKKYSSSVEFNVYTIYPNKDNQLVNDQYIYFLNGKPLAFGLVYFPIAFLYKILKPLGVKLPLPKNVRKMKESQFLLDIGGITFSDGRTLQLLYNVFSIWPAILMGVPVIKLSQAMGPFNSTLNYHLAKYFLSKCKMIFARGKITAAHLASIKQTDIKCRQAADIAFLFKPKYCLSKENEQIISQLEAKIKNKRNKGFKVISIIPSSLVFKKSKSQNAGYVSKLLILINEAYRVNAHIVIFPNASRAGSARLMNNDLIAINKIKEQFSFLLPEKVFSQIDWVTYDINTKSVWRLIDISDALITSRFHGMIAGLTLKVPTMVIGWSHKYQETLADFEMQDHSIDYQNDNLELNQLFIDFWLNKDDIRNTLSNQIDSVKDESKSQFSYLFKQMDK